MIDPFIIPPFTGQKTCKNGRATDRDTTANYHLATRL
jgi:hypothetical protein